ncbi:MAG: hypothetical protein ABR521_03615 [Gaiellaceae bacterium]
MALTERTLYPRGDYYGVVISAYRARCRGDFNSSNRVRNNQRYFNHLFCTLWDRNGRIWTLTYHQTSEDNWQYSNLREGGSGSPPARTSGAYFWKTPGEAAYCSLREGGSRLVCWTPNDGFTITLYSGGGRPSHYYSATNRNYAATAPLLGFGGRWAAGQGFSCSSASTGLTCTNNTGHGWWLGRYRGYRTW